MIMMTQIRIPRLLPARRAALGVVLGLSFLAESARADTTISTIVTVTDTITWTAGAGAVTINKGATLQFHPNNQGH